MSQIWLVTVPNVGSNNKKTYTSIQELLRNMKLNEIEIPNLVVGTLDSLIALADELSKICSQAESVVRKVARQYSDISGSDNEEVLRVNETTVEGFLYNFQWDYAQYQYHGRQLKEIIIQIQSMITKVDDDLKLLVNTYTEKSISLSTIKRKKNINLITSELEDFLEPKHVLLIDPINTENLLTLLVIVPKALESDFLNTYEALGSSIASYGGPNWNDINGSFSNIGLNDGNYGSNINRSMVTGSPIVPDSAKKILEEGEQVLYTVTTLKGHYIAGEFIEDVFNQGVYVDYIQSLKIAYKEKKFILREYVYKSLQSVGIDTAIKQGEAEMRQVRNTFVRWCKANFGACYNAWIHLKVIQAFIESVLRYGLPVNFTSFLMEPNMKNEKDSLQRLTHSILTLLPEMKEKMMLMDEDEEEEDLVNDTDHLPYVCLKLPIINNNNNNSNSF